MRVRTALLIVAAAFGGLAMLAFPPSPEPPRTRALVQASAAPPAPAQRLVWEPWFESEQVREAARSRAAIPAKIETDGARPADPGIWATPAEFSETD